MLKYHSLSEDNNSFKNNSVQNDYTIIKNFRINKSYSRFRKNESCWSE